MDSDCFSLTEDRNGYKGIFDGSTYVGIPGNTAYGRYEVSDPAKWITGYFINQANSQASAEDGEEEFFNREDNYEFDTWY